MKISRRGLLAAFLTSPVIARMRPKVSPPAACTLPIIGDVTINGDHYSTVASCIFSGKQTVEIRGVEFKDLIQSGGFNFTYEGGERPW